MEMPFEAWARSRKEKGGSPQRRPKIRMHQPHGDGHLRKGDRSRAVVPSPLHRTPKEGNVPMPNIPGGLAVSVVGIINGAINGIAPQVLVLLRSLGVPV
jgi:hypothetical protein